MTPLVREMVALAPGMAEQMHWFDASGLQSGHLVNLDSVNDNPLPYDHCAVCGFDGDAKWLVLLRQVENVVAVSGWSLHANRYEKHPMFTYSRSEDGVQLHRLDGVSQDTETIRGLLATIGGWLLSITPQTQAYTPKARPSLINSKRRAKGKPPALFDWHTVTIGPRPEPSPPKGGTHASPRAHDRRGHWRKHPSGKQVWVKACKVGDASKGSVFKDYKVKP